MLGSAIIASVETFWVWFLAMSEVSENIMLDKFVDCVEGFSIWFLAVCRTWEN